jgi:hypothetical protein
MRAKNRRNKPAVSGGRENSGGSDVSPNEEAVMAGVNEEDCGR